MARRKDNPEETTAKVPEKISMEEPKRERKRRTSIIIEEKTEAEEVKDLRLRKYQVSAEYLNVRVGPGYGYKVDRQLKKDTEVNVTEIDGDFGCIGPGLWVAMKFLK